VGDGDAICALDREWEAAWVAVDGEPRQWRCSGGVWWSGEGNSVEMHLCERKKESVGSSRTCSGSRRRRGHAGAGASGRRGVRGGSGGGGATWRGKERASAGRGNGGADAGAARGARKGGAGAAGVQHMAGEGGGVSGRETEEEGTRGRQRRIYLQFPKSTGTPL
jgi:hypothetical protein